MILPLFSVLIFQRTWFAVSAAIYRSSYVREKLCSESMDRQADGEILLLGASGTWEAASRQVSNSLLMLLHSNIALNALFLISILGKATNLLPVFESRDRDLTSLSYVMYYNPSQTSARSVCKQGQFLVQNHWCMKRGVVLYQSTAWAKH